MAVAIYNVRTLAVKEKNGYVHAECVLANARQLDCDFISLPETRSSGKTEFWLQGTGSSALGKKRWKARTDGVG